MESSFGIQMHSKAVEPVVIKDDVCLCDAHYKSVENYKDMKIKLVSSPALVAPLAQEDLLIRLFVMFGALIVSVMALFLLDYAMNLCAFAGVMALMSIWVAFFRSGDRKRANRVMNKRFPVTPKRKPQFVFSVCHNGYVYSNPWF